MKSASVQKLHIGIFMDGKRFARATTLSTKNAFTLAEEKPSVIFGPELIEQRYVWKKG